MLKFFVKHSKVRGVITVFLTMIYLSVYLLIGVFVDGGRIRMASAMIEDVQQIATENAMSQYNRGLYEYYGLFGVNETPDAISEDIKNQIEQTLGFKVSDDLIKDLLKDVTDSNKNDKWEKSFDPYGITIEKPTVKYIDLTETEAIRAQMRDEMRYKGLMAISENFFSAVAELVSFTDSVDAVTKITDEIDKVNKKMQSANKDYYKSLDNFTNEFKGFVELSYNTKEMTGIEKVASAAKNVLGGIGNFFADPINSVKELWNSIFGKKDETPVETESNVVDNEGNFEIDTNLNLKKDGKTGLLEVVTKHKNSLSRYYEEFDKYDDWSPGHKYVYSDDKDADPPDPPYYHADEHESAVASDFEYVGGNYKRIIKAIIGKLDNTLNRLNIAIENNEMYRSLINEVLKKLVDDCDKVDEDDKKTKSIYLSYIETYLRQWNSLAEQKVIFDNLDEKLNEIKSILNQSIVDVDNVGNDILGELSESWRKPHKKLTPIRKPQVLGNDGDSFHEIMLYMAENEEGLKTIQDTANGDEEQENMFSVINKVQGETENEEDTEEKKKKFGDIFEHEKSINVIFDPIKYEEEKESSSEDSTEFKFNKGNASKKVNSIMKSAKKIINDLPKSVVDNIYDEAYILSYCRDYVHTYRFLEKKYDELDDEERKEKKIDKVFNKKFIEDRSATEYLSNKQLEKLQVTPAEIEYILWGNKNSYLNIATMYANIFIIRLALNYIAAITSPGSAAEIHALAAASLVFAPVVEVAAPLIYAMPQAINETRKIMYDCKKVNLYNGGPHLHLWDGVKELAMDFANEGIDEARDIAKKTYGDARKNLDNLTFIGTEEMIEKVVDNVGKIADSDNIKSAAGYLQLKIDIGEYEAFTKDLLKDFDNAVEETIDNFAEEAKKELQGYVSNKIGVITPNDSPIKAGYSDYLLIYLFVGGAIDKQTQISRLQDIIETNMRKSEAGNDDFRLNGTFSQISVEVNSSIKYIFMTQSLMGKTFSNSKKYNKFNIKTKTSFAY